MIIGIVIVVVLIGSYVLYHQRQYGKFEPLQEHQARIKINQVESSDWTGKQDVVATTQKVYSVGDDLSLDGTATSFTIIDINNNSVSMKVNTHGREDIWYGVDPAETIVLELSKPWRIKPVMSLDGGTYYDVTVLDSKK